MAFDVSAGISAMGEAVAKTAGSYALEAQKIAAQEEMLKLADGLATTRESLGRAETAKYAEESQGREFKFKGDEGILNRASEEKRTSMTAGATVQSAKYSHDASKYVADSSNDYHKYSVDKNTAAYKEIAEINSRSREKVADTTSKAKLEIKGMTALSPEATETAAAVYNATGQMPAFGFGGAQAKQEILNVAAKMRKESGITDREHIEGTGTAKASQQAMGLLARQIASQNAFSATAEKNGELLLTLLDKGAGPSGVPVLDRWIQAGRKSIQGDADVAAFHAALDTYLIETAKVLSGASGGAPLSDSARKEMRDMVSTASTPEQIRAIVHTMAMERQNRVSSSEDELNNLRANISGRKEKVVPLPAATPANPKGERTVPIPRGPDGKVNPADLKPGTVYETERGLGRWNGMEFMPL